MLLLVLVVLPPQLDSVLLLIVTMRDRIASTEALLLPRPIVVQPQKLADPLMASSAATISQRLDGETLKEVLRRVAAQSDCKHTKVVKPQY